MVVVRDCEYDSELLMQAEGNKRDDEWGGTPFFEV